MTEPPSHNLFHEPRRTHELLLGCTLVRIDSQFGQCTLQLSLCGQSLHLDAEESMTLASALIAHAERLASNN
ncbi:hypothetical protein [Uliginosibacterium gangwonense]|uniref:hypothetical protein n=1 Tax=Uliginosibacterium gangwonense TaxID=392736 RepID=UPI00037596CF|nr:hypothetical protein [Uliginosibacterium gangwonense]